MPTPAPTPTPTPAPRNVGNYVCMTLGAATTALEGDGFTLGSVTAVPSGTPDATWVVIAQDPTPGTNRAYGTPINLSVASPGTPCP